MIRTIIFDDSTHKIVPIEPTDAQIKSANDHHEGGYYLPVSLYKAMIAAAPEYQEPNTDKLIRDLKASLRECMNEAAGWIDECRGCTPEDLIEHGWYVRANALLNEEPTKDE